MIMFSFGLFTQKVQAINQTNTPATMVLGKENLNRSLLEDGFNQPISISSNGQYYLVSDMSNNRALLYDGIPENVDEPYTILGQNSLTQSIYWGATASSLTARAATLGTSFNAKIFGEKIVATDSHHNRVLIWNNIPTTNNTPADIVLGQPDMVSGTANNGDPLY